MDVGSTYEAIGRRDRLDDGGRMSRPAFLAAAVGVGATLVAPAGAQATAEEVLTGICSPAAAVGTHRPRPHRRPDDAGPLVRPSARMAARLPTARQAGLSTGTVTASPMPPIRSRSTFGVAARPIRTARRRRLAVARTLRWVHARQQPLRHRLHRRGDLPFHGRAAPIWTVCRTALGDHGAHHAESDLPQRRRDVTRSRMIRLRAGRAALVDRMVSLRTASARAVGCAASVARCETVVRGDALTTPGRAGPRCDRDCRGARKDRSRTLWHARGRSNRRSSGPVRPVRPGRSRKCEVCATTASASVGSAARLAEHLDVTSLRRAPARLATTP